MDIAAQPGRDIGREIGRGEVVEHEITAFIEKRDKQRRQTECEHQAEEAWMKSERRHAQRRREANCQAWTAFHEEQAERHRRTLEVLIIHHETQAAKLMEVEPKGDAA